MVCGSDPGAPKSIAARDFGWIFTAAREKRNSFKINVWGGIRVPKISEEKKKQRQKDILKTALGFFPARDIMPRLLMISQGKRVSARDWYILILRVRKRSFSGWRSIGMS